MTMKASATATVYGKTDLEKAGYKFTNKGGNHFFRFRGVQSLSFASDAGAVAEASRQYGCLQRQSTKPTHALSDVDRRAHVIDQLRNHGGHFAQAIGAAIQHADSTNLARIAAAFPDLIAANSPPAATADLK